MTWEELCEKAKELGYKTEKNCCHRVGVLFEKTALFGQKYMTIMVIFLREFVLQKKELQTKCIRSCWRYWIK